MAPTVSASGRELARRRPSGRYHSTMELTRPNSSREVSVASLMAFLLALPIAFIALVPATAVSGTLKAALDAVAFVFPFKPALQAISNAFSGTAPGIGWPLVHLLVLTLAFAALARVAIKRFP